MARFRPLAELNLDHLDLIIGGLFGKALWVERAILVPAPEIARADFIDQVTPALAVVAADPAFAGVMGEPAHLGALVQRCDCVGRQ